MLKEVFTK